MAKTLEGKYDGEGNTPRERGYQVYSKPEGNVFLEMLEREKEERREKV